MVKDKKLCGQNVQGTKCILDESAVVEMPVLRFTDAQLRGNRYVDLARRESLVLYMLRTYECRRVF